MNFTMMGDNNDPILLPTMLLLFKVTIESLEMCFRCLHSRKSMTVQVVKVNSATTKMISDDGGAP
jgi:hypothetical protein